MTVKAHAKCSWKVESMLCEKISVQEAHEKCTWKSKAKWMAVKQSKEESFKACHCSLP